MCRDGPLSKKLSRSGTVPKNSMKGVISGDGLCDNDEKAPVSLQNFSETQGHPWHSVLYTIELVP